MADSDDEYDRKRRDKFRGERAEANYRGPERVQRPREDWVEREQWQRPRQREYSRGMRERYSPGLEPAQKRMRHDYYGDSFYNHYVPYHQPAHREQQAQAAQMEGQPPPMMSFKAFLATQDDNISDSEAIEKYNDYKLEFQRQQLNEFFVAHKDDEWFRLKYHPEDSVKRKEEQAAALKKRLEVFLDLLNGGAIDKITMDCPRTNDILRLLDTVVIKLEGGTDEDLALLEREYMEIEEKYKEQKAREEAEKTERVENARKKDEEEKKKEEKGEAKTNGESGEVIEEEGELDEEKPEEKPAEATKEEEEKMEEDEPKPEDKEEEEQNGEEKKEEDDGATPSEEQKDPEAGGKKRKRSSYSGSSSSSSSSNSDSEEEKKEEKKKSDEEAQAQENANEAGNKKENEEDKIETVPDDDKPEKPKSLHKTTSIFLRNLAPTITKQEVEAMCARYDGFLRVALADPQQERRWVRRGWVTFKREANIKEICWNLNNIRLRECELGAIVNRDLSRRIRLVNGITAHKAVVRSDIQVAAKVTLHLDTKAGLWLEGDDAAAGKKEHSFGLFSNNPVLHNITDYLIEEASAEEEELLGLESSADNQDAVSTVERDDALLQVLDRILLYLRIVHSLDYYNHCEYPNEDEMPNRCGIMHARGPPPTSKTDMTQFMGHIVEGKMASYLPEKPAADANAPNTNDQKLVALSLKDVDTEIDKFVQANTRELAKDKWLCPLSGKKFKGPDFVRKHIFNKHAEKIEEVKKEVEFFNNYLKDGKRPMAADAPTPKREDPPSYGHQGGGGGGYGGGSYGGGGGGGYGRNQGYYNQNFQRARAFPPRPRNNPGDFRPIVHYRDLDAPREPEEFI